MQNLSHFKHPDFESVVFDCFSKPTLRLGEWNICLASPECTITRCDYYFFWFRGLDVEIARSRWGLETHRIKSSFGSSWSIDVLLGKNVFFAAGWSIPHCVCVGRLIDLEAVQKSVCATPPKSWSRLQAFNKGVIEVQLLEVGVKVCR